MNQQGIILSDPNLSDGSPRRYGRDFYDPEVGAGRIEEAPPADTDSAANVVSRIIVWFADEELDIVDTKEVAPQGGSVPTDVSAFRRQIIHDEHIVDIINKCISYEGT